MNICTLLESNMKQTKEDLFIINDTFAIKPLFLNNSIDPQSSNNLAIYLL
jgi:hypothetical protein